MPELPEVETIRRQLVPLYEGETITDVMTGAPLLFRNCPPAEFARTLPGVTVERFYRKGKFLVMHCGALSVVFHLGMSGIFFSKANLATYPQHIHLTIGFKSGKKLFYQDMRKFGKIWLYRGAPVLGNLGRDPITDDITREEFAEMLHRHRRTVKLFLMNQTPIAGIGNIYASEILFAAKILPTRKTDDLTGGEPAALHEAIGQVLSAAIEKFGTTYSAYRTISGQQGGNQHFLQVYQRAGQPCYQCETTIEKTIMGSRSTFHCPTCQK